MGESIVKNLKLIPKVFVNKKLIKIGKYKFSSRTAGMIGRGILVRLTVGEC